MQIYITTHITQNNCARSPPTKNEITQRVFCTKLIHDIIKPLPDATHTLHAWFYRTENTKNSSHFTRQHKR